MRIAVIGPTLLTKRCLIELLKQKKDRITALFTLDDSSAKKKCRSVRFDDICSKYKIPLYKVSDINDKKAVEIIRKLSPDVIFELGWSQIITKEILQIPKKGCIGVHASLLPKNRGGASLNWALIKGAKKWGVTLYYLDEDIDKGKIIDQESFSITMKDDIKTVHDKSDMASAELLTRNLDAIRNSTVKPTAQDSKKADYLPRRSPEDGIIDWNKTSLELYNWVRALTHPFPGAFTLYKNKKLFIWKSSLPDKTEKAKPGQPGQIASIDREGILVKTKDKSILLKQLQFENSIELGAYDFAKKYKIRIGDVLQ